jgi:hypothetical protein
MVPFNMFSTTVKPVFGRAAVRFFVACIAVLPIMPASGKDAGDSTHVQRYNTVKIDFTSRFLYRNAFVMSYERVTRPNQSMVFTFGYQEIPMDRALAADIISKKTRESNGLKLGAEYRFYLGKENKYPVPRGVYIGPYLSYLTFHGDRTIEVTVDDIPEEGRLSTDFSVSNLGFQFGYQFLFNNRWSLDLVLLGPSFSHYKARMDLDGEFTFDPEDIENEILQELIDRFPGFSDLITDKTISSSGRASTWGYGWRYQFHIGYHFGRK